MSSAAGAGGRPGRRCTNPPLGERSLSLSSARRLVRRHTRATAHIAASLDADGSRRPDRVGHRLAALDEIISALGVFDALFFGPADMSVSLRKRDGADHPEVLAALDAAAEDHHRRVGMPLGIYCANTEQALRWAERGLTLLAIGSDLSMLTAAAQQGSRSAPRRCCRIRPAGCPGRSGP